MTPQLLTALTMETENMTASEVRSLCAATTKYLMDEAQRKREEQYLNKQ